MHEFFHCVPFPVHICVQRKPCLPATPSVSESSLRLSFSPQRGSAKASQTRKYLLVRLRYPKCGMRQWTMQGLVPEFQTWTQSVRYEEL